MNTAKKRITTQFDLTNDVLNNLSQYDLTPTAKLVLLYLTTCYNPKHKEVFPKQKTIADKLGISEISVTRAISELHKEGLILSERKISNKYVFTSRILSEQPIKMINDNLQNDRRETINLIAHNIEQIKETKKQQKDSSGGNVYRDEILREYAIKNHAKNIDAFVNYLKNEGRDEKIIQDHEQKQRIKEWGFKKTKIYDEARIQAQQNRVLPHTCEKLNEVLEKRYGIKK